ncbi:MAG: ABC transporter permease [Chloroflexales bacterium]|nr:ABC transporter permease [Chloroflexales bacterium]
MIELLEGLRQAVALLLDGDQATWEIISLSLYVSGVALALSAALGLPLGALLALRSFWGRRLLVALVYTGMGLPPVVVGLFVYLLLSRSGPLGTLGWLFTPRAMILAQSIISLPLVAGLTMAAIQGVDPALRLQLRALGADPTQVTVALLWEARAGVLVSLIAGFGAIISEVGAVMLVGGNIAGSTRVLTTAIVLETRKGEFELALALAFVLLAITFTINTGALLLQQRLAQR